MSISTGLYPLIYKCKLILGDAGVGVEDQMFEIALTENRVYHYRQTMTPLDTLQMSDNLYAKRPTWYTYSKHSVWQAIRRNWGVGASFINFKGGTVVPESFESETGIAVLSSPDCDVRITGYSYSIYRACLFVVINVMANRVSYYDYSTSGGNQDESQWFENLQKLTNTLKKSAEV